MSIVPLAVVLGSGQDDTAVCGADFTSDQSDRSDEFNCFAADYVFIDNDDRLLGFVVFFGESFYGVADCYCGQRCFEVFKTVGFSGNFRLVDRTKLDKSFSESFEVGGAGKSLGPFSLWEHRPDGL